MQGVCFERATDINFAKEFQMQFSCNITLFLMEREYGQNSGPKVDREEPSLPDHFEENRVKKRVNPLPPEQTKWFLENPQKFDIDKLEANEMRQGSGAQPIVKIPRDRDRIRLL